MFQLIEKGVHVEMTLALVGTSVANIPLASETLCIGIVRARTLDRSIDTDLCFFAVIPLTCRG